MLASADAVESTSSGGGASGDVVMVWIVVVVLPLHGCSPSTLHPCSAMLPSGVQRPPLFCAHHISKLSNGPSSFLAPMVAAVDRKSTRLGLPPAAAPHRTGNASSLSSPTCFHAARLGILPSKGDSRIGRPLALALPLLTRSPSVHVSLPRSEAPIHTSGRRGLPASMVSPGSRCTALI